MASIAEILATDILHNQDFQIATGTHDLATVSGLANVKGAILRRIMTTPGSVVHRPTYGVGLKDFQNAPMTLTAQTEIAGRLQRQLPLDPRVEEVTRVAIENIDGNPSLIKIMVGLRIRGYGDTTFTYTPFGELT